MNPLPSSFKNIGDQRLNPDGSVSTLVDNGDGSLGTLTTGCPKLPPLFMTRDGRIVGAEHPDALRGAL